MLQGPTVSIDLHNLLGSDKFYGGVTCAWRGSRAAALLGPKRPLNSHMPRSRPRRGHPGIAADDPHLCVAPLARSFPNATKAEIQAVQDRLAADFQQALASVVPQVRRRSPRCAFLTSATQLFRLNAAFGPHNQNMVQDAARPPPSSFPEAVALPGMTYEATAQAAAGDTRLPAWQAALSSVLSTYFVHSHQGSNPTFVVSCPSSPRRAYACGGQLAAAGCTLAQ